MKKKIVLSMTFISIMMGMIACGDKKTTESEEGDGYGAYETGADKVTHEDALTLIDKSDCIGCHHKTNKVIGPTYMEIAKKYEYTSENVTMLADKIINGGSGNWGGIAMTAHKGISQDDAEKIAHYVLSLDGEKRP